MDEARQAAILSYCRIDEPTPDDLALLEVMYASACAYMEQAGVSQPEAGTPRAAMYDLVVNALVLDAWDSRQVIITGTIVADNPSFRRMLNQLKLTEPVSDPDTSEGGA